MQARSNNKVLKDRLQNSLYFSMCLLWLKSYHKGSGMWMKITSGTEESCLKYLLGVARFVRYVSISQEQNDRKKREKKDCFAV